MLTPGLTHTSEFVVTDVLTAAAMGSGDMDVLATPAMTALMENAAMLAVASELPDDSTTVGGYIESSHLAPTPVLAEVHATATLTKMEGRKLEFAVEAYAGKTLIGRGTHIRFIVDRHRFLSKLH